MEPNAPDARQRVDRLANDARILEAAARLFADDPHASISAIAEAAGVARLTVYRRYPNRDAVVQALMERVEREIMTALDTFPGWADGASAFHLLVATMTRTAHRYPIVLRDHTVSSTSPVDARLLGILTDGQRAGVLRVDVPPDLLNGCLFALIRAHHQLRPGGDADEAATTAADLLLRGAGSPQRPVGPASAQRDAE